MVMERYIINRKRDEQTGIVTYESWWGENGKRHRTDGPAAIQRDPTTGTVTREAWFEDGRRHRTDGPAVIERDATAGIVTREEWWRDDKQIEPPSRPSLPSNQYAVAKEAPAA